MWRYDYSFALFLLVAYSSLPLPRPLFSINGKQWLSQMSKCQKFDHYAASAYTDFLSYFDWTISVTRPELLWQSRSGDDSHFPLHYFCSQLRGHRGLGLCTNSFTYSYLWNPSQRRTGMSVKECYYQNCEVITNQLRQNRHRWHY